MTRRLLVPLDGMPLAEKALPLARVLAGALDADLELLQVILPEDVAAEDSDSRARGYLAAVAGGLAADKLEPVGRVVHGEPGSCIVQVAATDHAASVVMTTHARSGVRRAVLGSVAEQVVAHSPCPTVL